MKCHLKLPRTEASWLVFHGAETFIYIRYTVWDENREDLMLSRSEGGGGGGIPHDALVITDKQIGTKTRE